MPVDTAIQPPYDIALLEEAEAVKVKDKDRAYALVEKFLDQLGPQSDRSLELRAKVVKAYVYHHSLNAEKFFREINEAIELSEKLSDELTYCYCKYLLGCCFRNLGDLKNSGASFLESLNKAEQTGDIESNIRAHNGMGHLYHLLGNKEKALDHFNRGLEFSKKVKVSEHLPNLMGNQAEVFMELGKYDEARDTLNKILSIYQQIGDQGGAGLTRLRLARIHLAKNENGTAIELMQELYKDAFNNQFKIGVAVVGKDLAEVLVNEGRAEEASAYIDESIRIAEQINNHKILHDLYYLKYKRSLAQGNYKEALHYHELFHKFKQTSVEREAELNLKNAETLTEIRLVKKEAELNQQKHAELRKAYEEIEIKNKEITDSIKYSRRIQTAILPTSSALDISFGDHFVFYQPKDIVSGDFYWLLQEVNGDPDLSLLAVADCTGHGVPGALMSMIGHTLLSQIVVGKHITCPSAILEQLDKDLCTVLNVHSSEARDGMDISVCLFNSRTGEVQLSSANRPSFIYRIKENAITEVSGTKRPIGYDDVTIPFVLHKFHLAKGDIMYLFTDGYSDQFGGEKGKKLMLKNFRAFVASVAGLPLVNQGKAIGEFFNNWKGTHEQIDDVTVFGFSVK